MTSPILTEPCPPARSLSICSGWCYLGLGRGPTDPPSEQNPWWDLIETLSVPVGTGHLLKVMDQVLTVSRLEEGKSQAPAESAEVFRLRGLVTD